MVGDRKLAGILLERQSASVVIGIGVNLVEAPAVAGRGTISLSGLGVTMERNAFAIRLGTIFAEEVAHWRSTGVQPLLVRWMKRAHPIGTELLVRGSGEAVKGTFDGLDGDGGLRLRLQSGELITMRSGEVLMTPSVPEAEMEARDAACD